MVFLTCSVGGKDDGIVGRNFFWIFFDYSLVNTCPFGITRGLFWLHKRGLYNDLFKNTPNLQYNRGEPCLFKFMCDSNLRDPSQVDNSMIQKLDHLLLELLESPQYQKLDHTRYITCISDITMILLSLNPDGPFCKPSETTHHCALMQYMMQTTTVHSLHLHTLGEEAYVPFSSPNTPSDNEIIEEPDGSFLLWVQTVTLSIIPLYWILFLYRHLHQVQEYILLKDSVGLESTPFTHMNKIRLSDEKGAQQEHSQLKLAWVANHEEFYFSCPHYPTLHITLTALMKMACTIEDNLILS